MSNTSKILLNKKIIKSIIYTFLLISGFIIGKPLYAYSPTPRIKACFSNQRVCLGAIEMYNMDNSKPITTALPGGDFEKLLDILIKDKYLKDYLIGPDERCSYGYLQCDEDKSIGLVFCKYHGGIRDEEFISKNKSLNLKNYTIEGHDTVILEYNLSLEKPFSPQFKKRISDELSSRERAINFRNFDKKYFIPLAISFSILIAIIVMIIIGKIIKKDDRA